MMTLVMVFTAICTKVDETDDSTETEKHIMTYTVIDKKLITR